MEALSGPLRRSCGALTASGRLPEARRASERPNHRGGTPWGRSAAIREPLRRSCGERGARRSASDRAAQHRGAGREDRASRATRRPAAGSPAPENPSLIFFTSLESAVGTYKQKTLARFSRSRALTAKALQTRAAASLTLRSRVIAQANGPQLDVRGRFEARSGADRADFGGLSEEPETADWTRGPPIRAPQPPGRAVQLPGAAIRSSLRPAARPGGNPARRALRDRVAPALTGLHPDQGRDLPVTPSSRSVGRRGHQPPSVRFQERPSTSRAGSRFPCLFPRTQTTARSIRTVPPAPGSSDRRSSRIVANLGRHV